MIILVKIRRLQGEDEDINIDNQCTILELKQYLHCRLGIEPAQQRLIFCGHVLDDTRTISDCNIGDNQVVHMVTRPPPLPSRSEPIEPDVSELDSTPSHSPFGHPTFVVVTHGEHGNLSPTAIRLRILNTIVNELRTGILDLEADPDALDDLEVPGNGNPVMEFAQLVTEVHRLDRMFETHRENYLTIINEVRDNTTVPRDERSIQVRMRYSEQINAIFHNMAHAFHLISDIALLESPQGTQLASEAFLRQGHTASVEGHPVRTANLDSNINGPFNVEIDPIMIQLQIETSEPTNGQGNANNIQADVEMEEANNPISQDARYVSSQEYLRSLEQRMISAIQPGLRNTAAAAAALDFGMELDDSPLGPGNLQEFLGSPPNLAGIVQNAQSPVVGGLSTDLIQQILSSVIRTEVSGVNWNPEQNASEPSAGQENERQPSRPSRDEPDQQPEQRRISISNIVYDQATPCESRHTRRALHLRSGINPAEFPMQHNDAASTRAFFTVQSLYDRFDRNPRSPDNLVTAYFLLLRESVVPGPYRYLSTHELLQVGDVVVAYFRGLLQSVSYDESVEKVTDIILSKHTKFLRRVPLMVLVSSDINMTASIRAVLCHHMPAIFNLISIREPSEFCRSMRLLVPVLYQDMCTVLYHCVGRCSVALETVFRAYLIECLGNMDETNRDLLLNIAFYCMSAGIYRASMPSDVPQEFIVQRPPHERNNSWNPFPQPSTSRVPTESNVTLTRDMYSGNLPRARPVTPRSSNMRMRSAIPLDSNRPTWHSTESDVSQIRTPDSVTPPASPDPTTASASNTKPPVSIFASDSATTAPVSTSASTSAVSAPVATSSSTSATAPPATASATTSATTSATAPPVFTFEADMPVSVPASAFPMSFEEFASRHRVRDPAASMRGLHFDWWNADDDQLIVDDSNSESGRNSPTSDAYHVGHSQRNQDAAHEQKPPTDLNSFAQYVLNDLGEDLEVDHRMRSMFLAFLSSSIEERTLTSPDYDEIQFLASRILTDNTLTQEETQRFLNELRNRCHLVQTFGGQEWR